MTMTVNLATIASTLSLLILDSLGETPLRLASQKLGVKEQALGVGKMVPQLQKNRYFAMKIKQLKLKAFQFQNFSQPSPYSMKRYIQRSSSMFAALMKTVERATFVETITGNMIELEMDLNKAKLVIITGSARCVKEKNNST